MRHVMTAMAIMAAAALAIGLAGCVPPKKGAAAPGKLALRVNAGAEKEYVDQSGAAWLPDQEWKEGAKYGAVDGKTVVRQNLKITGTKAPEVYVTERYSMTAYRFAVPNGKYAVRLHFAETYPDINTQGPRVFSVAIQGKPVLTDFDVMKTAGGFAKPVIKEFTHVEVADGKLLIEFAPKSQNPEINGIEVIAQ
jgi:hypothetical protein